MNLLVAQTADPVSVRPFHEIALPDTGAAPASVIAPHDSRIAAEVTARAIKQDLEQIPGVDQVIALGFQDPELRVEFDPPALAGVQFTETEVLYSDQYGQPDCGVVESCNAGNARAGPDHRRYA